MTDITTSIMQSMVELVDSKLELSTVQKFNELLTLFESMPKCELTQAASDVLRLANTLKKSIDLLNPINDPANAALIMNMFPDIEKQLIGVKKCVQSMQMIYNRINEAECT